MLRFLGVRNLAVIDHLEIEFEPGLNILTGETGAGKSVLIEAIDLLLGGRASADLVRTGEDIAAVQAVLERADGREVIVRREISSQGRSRGFIDDALATSAALRDLGVGLIELHGQHEHQSLLDPDEHLNHLDAFLRESELLGDVAACFDAWRAAAVLLERSRMDTREKQARIDMASFQLHEIDAVAPVDGEDEQLAGEKRLLANVERLSALSTDAYGALYEGEHAALASLTATWKRVAELAALDPSFAPYVEQREMIKTQLDDLAFFLRSYSTRLESSPGRLQAVEDRLAALERLQRKYGPRLADVLVRQRALRDELASLATTEERAAELAAEERQTFARFVERANALTEARRLAAARLSRDLERELAALAMPKSRVDVRVTPLESHAAWSGRGRDAVEILLSPNPGEELRPLARIASGGELSRIMLALRTLAAQSDTAGTLIFDEVDAGIGGEAADAVGIRLRSLAERFQVLCITHLPQIAAYASAHFRIAKQVRSGRTTTEVARLDQGGREMELARMIAGAGVTPQVVASARELLQARGTVPGESEATAKGERPGQAKAKGRKRGA